MIINKEILDQKSALLLNNINRKSFKYKRMYFNYLKNEFRTRNIVLIGLRQIGKTTLMEQLGVDYLKSIHQDDNFNYTNTDKVVYINLLSLTTDLDDKVNSHELMMYITSKKAELVMIDEIQMIKNWTMFAQVLIDLNNGTRFIFSGSSAKALKKEIMVGRALSYFIKPLFFEEYKKIWADDDFNQYIRYGTYPKSSQDTPELQYHNLAESTIIGKILLKDIDEKIDHGKFKLTLKGLTNYVGNEVPITTFIDVSSVSRPARNLYMKVMEETRLIRRVSNYGNNSNNVKIYLEDICMINYYKNGVLNNNDIGAVIENLVFNYLDYIYNTRLGLEKVFYFKPQKEIDFIIPDFKTIVEVKYVENLDPIKLTNDLNEMLWDEMNDYNKYVISKNVTGTYNGWQFITLMDFINGKYKDL